MWIERDIKNLHLDATTGGAVAIGAFDGVHRGHQTLIGRTVVEARAQGMVPLVLTFDPLPGQALGRGEYGLLSTLEERLERISRLGVAGTVILPFNRQLMETPAGEFVDLMVTHLRLRALFVGPDFKLGKNREGDIPFLRRLGESRGYEVHTLDETILWEDRPVRSSRIRRALKSGAIEEANGCLGYPYALSGLVGHGDKRGRGLGFPTANLVVPEDRLLPANGIYVCQAHLTTGYHHAITNVGTRPTFNHSTTTVEAYLLDFSGDLYGKRLALDFLTRLRPEERFASAEALVAQMRRDETEARAWFARHQEGTSAKS